MQRDGGPGPGGGPGGGGNPIGGSFTGASKSLEYIGDFAYAMSGPIQINGGTNTVHLDFKTGNSLVVGEFIFVGGALPSNTGVGTLSIFRIRVNGSAVNYIKLETTSEDMPSIITFPFLIPAYTEIQIAAENGDSTAGMYVETNFVGRIYRG